MCIFQQLSEKMQMHMPDMSMTDFSNEGGDEDDDTARIVAQKQAQVCPMCVVSNSSMERFCFSSVVMCFNDDL